MTEVDTDEVVRIEKPWGFEQVWALVPGKYCAKRIYLRKGHRLSLQYHVLKDETMLLESGIAHLLIGQTLSTLERIDMVGGRPVRIRPGVIHRLCAESDTMVLEVSTTELDDVCRLDDDYHR